MKLIEKTISNLFGRFHVQWEEKQPPLFVLHFPQVSRILEKSHLIGIRHVLSSMIEKYVASFISTRIGFFTFLPRH